MPSATPADTSHAHRFLRLILLALLPAFTILALALLALTYYSSSRIMEQSLQTQFQQAGSQLQNNLDTYINKLNTLLSATVEHTGLARKILDRDRAGAEEILQV